ncbi:hypothetical protein NTGM5_180084 [Candidatus Nitrotoga sp. M5]|nr:hypothetical protein NTGM5_180084 [Candidatus Nitrotoga sp. M5]
MPPERSPVELHKTNLNTSHTFGLAAGTNMLISSVATRTQPYASHSASACC